MAELFPVAAGFMIGLFHGRSTRLSLGAPSVVLGVYASLLSGELETSWVFLFLDSLLVLGIAWLVSSVLRRVRLRAV